MPELIKITSLTKTYKLGDEILNALDNVTLNIRAGEFVAITGPSGSGKSTLANIISGLDRPTKGSIIVDGSDLSKMKDRKLSDYRNKNLGYVFQSFNLQGNQTALENVMMPMYFSRVGHKDRHKRARECLESVGLGDRINHKPGQLSGGQRQRVAIARALALNPKIIIADEPTGNLDSVKGQEILSVLKDLNEQGITLIIITHDQTIAREASRIIKIHDGKVRLR